MRGVGTNSIGPMNWNVEAGDKSLSHLSDGFAHANFRSRTKSLLYSDLRVRKSNECYVHVQEYVALVLREVLCVKYESPSLLSFQYTVLLNR